MFTDSMVLFLFEKVNPFHRKATNSPFHPVILFVVLGLITQCRVSAPQIKPIKDLFDYLGDELAKHDLKLSDIDWPNEKTAIKWREA